MATYDLETLKNFNSNDFNKSKQNEGTYGEGVLGRYSTAINDLKSYVSNGTLTIPEYLNIAEPIVKSAKDKYFQIANSGSKAATAANSAAKDLFDNEVLKWDSGKLSYKVPTFTSREYANLPENVLPTQKEIDSGIVPIEYVPSTRVRTDTSETSSNDPMAAFLAGYNNPDLTPDQSLINSEAKQYAYQQGKLLAWQKSQREAQIPELQTLLNKQNDLQFAADQPGIYEDMNARGLLHSSALGEALAKEKASLTQATDLELAKQKLAAGESYTSGIGDALSNYQNMLTSGLQRRFSVSDYEKEAELAKQLSALSVPTTQSNYNSTTGGISGALTGAATGYSTTGNAWGALAGAVGGGYVGSKGGK